MKVITYHVGIVSRGKGRSVVQLAAYCARDKLDNAYNGKSYDYTRRSDLVFHEILLPSHAPPAFHEQSILWNAVEQVEKNRNARLARVAYFALPRTLDRNIQIDMARNYVQEFFVYHGMCADLSIHDKGDGNPHVHVLLTTRSIDEKGKWMVKQRRNFVLREDGTRIRDPNTNHYLLGQSIKTNNWDNACHIERWRKGWADACNCEFERQGIDERVTHISYARQGIDREPTKHLGARVLALEARGIPTDRGDENRAIKTRNRKRARQQDREQVRGLEQVFDKSR